MNQESPNLKDVTRKSLILWILFIGVAFIALTMFVRTPKKTPKARILPGTSFRAGTLGEYANSGVYTNYKTKHGVWLVRLAEGRLVALSVKCTHLGCIPNWLSKGQKFTCPCDGSGYRMSGINFEGPAPRSLERYKITLERQNVIVDKSAKFRHELGEWDSPDSYVKVE